MFKLRIRSCTVCLLMICTLFLGLCVGMFFEKILIVPLLIVFIVLVNVVLEWLKIKYNHLVIKSTQIEITNRFNKTKIHNVRVHELTLELRFSFNRRSGGILMRFYDADGNLICKYEDMFNRAAPYRAAPWGFDKTNWEREIEGLNIKIIDTYGIIRN